MRTCLCAAGVLISSVATALGAPHADSLPIREVTVFKDGHAMVLRSGSVSTDEQGDAVLDELPQPVLGTFWASEVDADAQLRSVRASRQEEERLRRPESVEELVRANIGRTILWKTDKDETREATILDLLVQESTPTTPTTFNGRSPIVPYSRPVAAPAPRVGSKTVLLRFEDGATLALPIEQLRSVTFTETPDTSPMIAERVETERLTLDLAWDGAPNPEATIGLMYIQRGLRWIPGYRVTMLEGGRVRVELQATLINELADLSDVSCNLVIGVPRFEFEHTMDPIALNDVVASLGPYFQSGSQTGGMLSNALMSQTARMGDYQSAPTHSAPTPPELTGSERAEDLYLFSVDHITLRRGERMVIPIDSFETTYQPVYKLNLPIDPPVGAMRNFNTEQQRRLAELMSQPRAMHTLRITNTSEHPITTAPAMIVQKNGMPLAQGMLTYTSPGARVDLEVTTAVDIQVETDSTVLMKKPETSTWQGYRFERVDLQSGCSVTNRKTEPVRLEIRAYALGMLDSASDNAETAAVNIFTEHAIYSAAPDDSAWWRWWSWPWWWAQRNGAARIEWELDLKPGETIELQWQHHYFWQI